MHYTGNFNFALLDKMNRLTLELILQKGKMANIEDKMKDLKLNNLPQINYPEIHRTSRKRISRRKDKENSRKIIRSERMNNSSKITYRNSSRRSKNNSVFLDSGRTILKRLSKFEKKLDGFIYNHNKNLRNKKKNLPYKYVSPQKQMNSSMHVPYYPNYYHYSQNYNYPYQDVPIYNHQPSIIKDNRKINHRNKDKKRDKKKKIIK